MKGSDVGKTVHKIEQIDALDDFLGERLAVAAAYFLAIRIAPDFFIRDFLASIGGVGGGILAECVVVVSI